jgi:hypothetical protein
MITLIHKEVRLLRGAWVAALLLAVLPVWLVPVAFHMAPTGIDTALLSLVCFGLGTAALGIAPFLQEFRFKTFNLLLLQPQARSRLFFVKTATLSVAMLSVWLALYLSCQFRYAGIVATQPLDGWLWPAAMVAIMALSGLGFSLYGQCDTVGFRSWCLMVTAILAGGGVIICLFWPFITSLDPLAFGVQSGTGKQAVDMRVTASKFCLVLAYAAAGIWWGRWQFLNAQDVPGWDMRVRKEWWMGGGLSLSFARWLARPGLAGRRMRPTEALIRKELQLHHQFVVILLEAIFISVLALVAPAGRTRFYGALDGLRMACLFPLLMVPLWVGGAAVAVERELGVMDSFWHLPIGRLRQFVTKLGVVLLLTFLLGAVMLCVIESAAAARGLPTLLGKAFPTYFGKDLRFWQLLATLSEIAGILAGLSFYASTLHSRDTGFGALIAAALGVAILMARPLSIFGIVDDLGPLLGAVGGATTLVALLCLSFYNCKHPQIAKSTVRLNAVVWLGALLFVPAVSLRIYFKPWDRFTSLEPAHGPSQLNRSGRTSLLETKAGLFVLLADGRLWTAQDSTVSAQPSSKTGERFWRAVPEKGTFIGGGNWVDVVAGDGGICALGIKSDGTLWKVSASNLPDDVRIQIATSRSGTGAAFHIAYRTERIGTDSDWTMLSRPNQSYLALKRDGSLWGWRDNEPPAPDGRPGKTTRGPVRIGDDSDWVAVSGEYDGGYVRRTVALAFASVAISDEYAGGYIAIKNDGSVWKWGLLQHPAEKSAGKSAWTRQLHTTPVRWTEAGTNWVVLDGNDDRRFLALHERGGMWAFGGQTGEPKLDWIGPDTEWQPVENGRPFPELKRTKNAGRAAIQHEYGWKYYLRLKYYLSDYSDWITQSTWDRWDLNEAQGTDLPGTTLAADGTFSHWDLSHGLLGPSRRPVWSINILKDKP